MPNSYYQKHVFFCVNQKDLGRKCCAAAGAQDISDYTKKKLQDLGISKYCVRINNTGCLGCCSEGPTMVIYPEGTWYTYRNQSDIDQIIDKHLLQNKPVTHLQMKSDSSSS